MNLKHFSWLGLVITLALLYASCGEQEEGITGPGGQQLQGSRVSGIVTERKTTGIVSVRGANVNLRNAAADRSTTTDSIGQFFFQLSSDSVARQTTITVTKQGYRTKTTSFTLQPESFAEVQIEIQVDTTTIVGPPSGGSGYANTIALLSVSQKDISVSGVGGTETSLLIVEVRDSLGNPVDLDHGVAVRFTIVSGPGGGEYVSPESSRTNVSGRAATTVNSGIRSGPVQVSASAQVVVGGSVVRTIQSTPVRINIHGGLPDQQHFGIGMLKVNFPGYDILGATNTVSVVVGDRYSNPVAPNTAVYFSTTGGVVTASGYTDPSGRASATLISLGASQRPNHAVYGPGYAFVSARTIGVGGVTVSDSALTLFSGTPRIVYCIGDTLNCRDEICFSARYQQNVYLQVSDQNGNPLSSGTTITAQVLQVASDSSVVVDTRGLPSDPIGDYLFGNTSWGVGRGPTRFILTVYDATTGGARSDAIFTVRIRASGPNGIVSADLPGRILRFGTPTCP